MTNDQCVAQLAACSPLDRVAVQSIRNTAAALGENALLLRSLLEGGNINQDGSTGGKKGRKRKAGGDSSDAPTKPKRAATGYILFSKDKRPSVVAAAPSPLRPPEVMTKLGALWKALSKEEQAVWNARAKAAASADAAV